MKVFINLTKDRIEVKIGDKILDIISGVEIKENDSTSHFAFTDDAFRTIIGFIEKYAFADRLILKNRTFLSYPRKIYVRSEFTSMKNVKDIMESSDHFWGHMKIYSSSEITFQEMFQLKLENKAELIKKYFLDVRLKHVIGETAYSNWKKEILIIHLSVLGLGLIEFYFLKSFIVFPVMLWIAWGIWMRLRFKSSIYKLVVSYFLFIFPLYLISILIASSRTSQGMTTISELTFIASSTGALIYLIVHFFMVRLYLHLYKPLMKENNKNELQQRI